MSQEQEPELAPPWIAYPGYTRYTIGWRMGSGEDHLWKWWQMLREFPTDYATRVAYLARYRPAPRVWADTVAQVLEIEDETSFGVRREILENLLEQDLVRDDVAFGTWCEEVLGTPTGWIARSTPSSVARYSSRDLSFLCRHLHALRGMPEQRAELDRVLPDDEDWRAFRALLERAPDDHDFDLPPFEDGGMRLAMELASFGWPTPPWEYGLEPTSDDHDDAPEDYAYLWDIWVTSAIDDTPTFRSYLSRYKPHPPEWGEVVAPYL